MRHKNDTRIMWIITKTWTPQFHARNHIWFKLQNIQTTQPSRKHDYQRLGSITIIHQVNTSINFRLKLPNTMHIHPIFYVHLLEAYHESKISNRILLSPPPIEIDYTLQYEINEILDSCIQHGCLEYFIYWKAYGISKHTREPRSNIKIH